MADFPRGWRCQRRALEGGPLLDGQRRAIAPDNAIHFGAIGREQHQFITAVGQGKILVAIGHGDTAIEGAVTRARQQEILPRLDQQIGRNDMAIIAEIGQHPIAQVDGHCIGVIEFEPLALLIAHRLRIGQKFSNQKGRWRRGK